MPIYRDWNNAIADHFARTTPRGGAFYLAVDEDALNEIGATAFPRAPSDAAADFERAVRSLCVRSGVVRLPSVQRNPRTNAPRCLAFLAAMSLAAHKMAPEDDIGEHNYFTRLREILGLTDGDGRPDGMEIPPGEPAPEEKLWRALNVWASQKGWQPTAEPGTNNFRKYINYPISQALLRDGDKGKLERSFRNAVRALGRNADREKVAAWFVNNSDDLTSHISNLARDAAERFDSVIDAVYDVYASIDWDADPDGETAPSPGTRMTALSAGLYRRFRRRSGAVYYLYPRRRSRSASGLSAIRNGEPAPLRQNSDGVFSPLWEVDPAGGQAWEVVGDPAVSEMRLPERDFWVLTRDRPDDKSGPVASRGSPRLGEPFLFLCKDRFAGDMMALRRARLLQWEGEPESLPRYNGWVEFRECVALSADWSAAIGYAPANLFNELRPTNRASISLPGGLKARERDTWIEGCAPYLKVASQDACHVLVSNVSNIDRELEIDETAAPDSEPIDLSALEPGDYRIEVFVGGKRADRRPIKIVSWDSLTPAEPSVAYETLVGEFTLRGALLAPSASATDC